MRYIFLTVMVLVFLIRYQGINQQTPVTTDNIPLGSLRMKMQTNLIKWLPGDTGPLASGILLGGNQGLSFEAKTAFRKSGLMHVTAASGYNVVVVAGWVMTAGKKLWGRKPAVGSGILSVVLYMFLAGLSAAVVRAGIMAILTMAAAFWGRKSDAGWTLVLASMLMLIIRPQWVSDIGFQLSVAATAGLIWLAVGSGLLLADLKTTIAAQIATLPLILHYFGNLSLFSPIVNLLVLWTVPVIMEISAIASVLGLVWQPLGGIVILAAWPFLAFMDRLVEWAATWPGAGLEIGKLDWIWVGIYYLAVAMLFPRKKNEAMV